MKQLTSYFGFNKKRLYFLAGGLSLLLLLPGIILIAQQEQRIQSQAAETPLTIDVHVGTNYTGTNKKITSPLFSTTQAGELVLVMISSDAKGAGDGVTSVSGGNLQFTFAKRSTLQKGYVEIWYAYSPTQLNNVTVAVTRQTAGYHGMIDIVTFKGARPTIGATGAAHAPNGASSVSLTTTVPGSWVWGVGNDWDGAQARTLGSGQAMSRQFVDKSVGDTFWSQYQLNRTVNAGTTVVLNTTSPTNHSWNMVAVEIVPASQEVVPTVATLPTILQPTIVIPISSPSPTPTITSSTPSGTVLRATPATFATVFSGATGGETILLASGNYGIFRGSTKSSIVTLKPDRGAIVTITPEFNGASNITLDGFTVPGGELLNATRNITIKNSKFTGPLKIDGLANANVLLDRNTHNNISISTSCTGAPARIHLSYSTQTHSGVTIQNSQFDGGNTDGIQTGNGVNIINNEFSNIHERDSNDCAHSDPIQLIGAAGSIVRGNYIHHSADGIVAYDGLERATIEKNVVHLVNGRWGIELASDNGSIVRHNTVVYGTGCEYAPCGWIVLDHKTSDPAGRETIVEDNVAYTLSLNNGSTAASNRNNMLRTGASGANITGIPVFAGGANPTTYEGFRLAPSSPGKNAASDGTDIGI